MYSEQDLKNASEFRDGIHREALARVRAVYPNADHVIDPYPPDSYFQEVWDYPGKWYTIVGTPNPKPTIALPMTILVNRYPSRLKLPPYAMSNTIPARQNIVSAMPMLIIVLLTISFNISFIFLSSLIIRDIS